MCSGVVGRLLDIQLEGLDCGDDVANWISQFIGLCIFLIYIYYNTLFYISFIASIVVNQNLMQIALRVPEL